LKAESVEDGERVRPRNNLPSGMIGMLMTRSLEIREQRKEKLEPRRRNWPKINY
jgi:hypothetical protein